MPSGWSENRSCQQPINDCMQIKKDSEVLLGSQVPQHREGSGRIQKGVG